MYSNHLVYRVLLAVLLWTVTADSTNDVTLSNVVIDSGSKSFHVQCTFAQLVKTLDRNNPFDQIEYRIRFLADTTVVEDRELVYTEVRLGKAFLPYESGIDKNLNKYYQCEVTAHVNGSQTNVTETSEKKFLGIRAQQNQLNVNEGDTKHLEIVSTVPVLCERSFGKHCCLELDLQIGSHLNQLSTFTKCFYKMCSTDWDPRTGAAIIKIPVMATADAIKDGDKDLRIKFRPLIPSGGGRVKQVFENVKIPPVQVKVIDVPDGVCGIGGDPHIFRFSKKKLNFQEVGDYVLYENREQDFDVHVRTWPCGRGTVTCVQAILIHEGNDVLRVSLESNTDLNARIIQQFLAKRTSRRTNRIRQLKLHMTLATDNKNLSDGTTVSRHSRSIVVNTPSGAKMTIGQQTRALHMLLKLPPKFMQDPNQNGLCGQYTTNTTGLVDRHGQQHPCSKWGRSARVCRNIQYSESWKLDRNSTLFYNPPQRKLPRETDKTLYCACAENVNSASTPTINCTGDGNKIPIKKGCNGCTSLNGGLPTGIYGGTFGKRDADQSLGYSPYDPFFINEKFPDLKGPETYPNVSSQTLDKMEKECLNALQQAALNSHCGNFTEVQDDYLNQCVDDYVLVQNDRFIKDAVAGYNEMCLHEIQQDPNNFITKPDGTMVIKEEIDHLCPQSCQLHELCDKGACVCENGWTGIDCDVPMHGSDQQNSSTTLSAQPTTTPATTPPTIPMLKMTNALSYKQRDVRINGDNCDQRKGQCWALEILIERVEQGLILSCVWEELQGMYNNTIVSTSPTVGFIIAYNTVRCAIPNTLVPGAFGAGKAGAPYKMFNVILKHGSTVVSDRPSTMTFYDSDCVIILHGKVIQSGKSCMIDGHCYSDGSHNPKVSNERCVTYLSTNSWTSHTSRSVHLFVNGRNATSQVVPVGHTNISITLKEAWLRQIPASLQCWMSTSPTSKALYYSNYLLIWDKPPTSGQGRSGMGGANRT